jgi:predicted SAM-dependent methyltransferase
MNSTTAEPTTVRPVTNVSQKRVLNAGSGPRTGTGLHPLFRQQSWEEFRLDIDPKVQPDIIGSVTDMKTVADESFDAIWCSHNLEHLYNHEIGKALAEFRRVLKSDGFSLITCPDLEEVAGMVASGKGEDVAYHSPVGPITAFDMLYGHAASIARGNEFMAHRTGFTADRLGRMLVESGFDEVFVTKGKGFDLWALALMPGASRAMLQDQFYAYGLDFFAEG